MTSADANATLDRTTTARQRYQSGDGVAPASTTLA
jgi:hypothetical protein